MRPERYTYHYGSGGTQRPRRARVGLAVLVLLGVALLLMTRLQQPLVTKLRLATTDLLAPVMEGMAMPVRGFHRLIDNKVMLFTAYEENKLLHTENDTLRHWQTVAQALKAENESLRQLMAYKPVEHVDYVTAKIIAQSPSAYSGTLMMNAGAEQGLISLQPVIDSYGLVGRVVEVGDRTARVLLLSDNASRVPVITADSRVHAILTGTGDALLRLTFVGDNAETITLGESVMTTSEGGLMPDSVTVGTVFGRDATGLLVKPWRPLAASEYVRVMVAR